MSDDNATVRYFRTEISQAVGNVLIRESVKAIATDALLIKSLGNCVMVGDRTVRAMKRRIEACDLKQLRLTRH